LLSFVLILFLRDLRVDQVRIRLVLHDRIRPSGIIRRASADNGTRGHRPLNVEKSLNSLSLEMIDLLLERLSVWASDPGVAFVVLEAAGEKAFCAGADLHNLHRTMVEHHASPQRDDIRGNTYALAFCGARLDYLIQSKRCCAGGRS
jgi:hypothetical protein